MSTLLCVVRTDRACRTPQLVFCVRVSAGIAAVMPAQSSYHGSERLAGVTTKGEDWTRLT